MRGDDALGDEEVLRGVVVRISRGEAAVKLAGSSAAIYCEAGVIGAARKGSTNLDGRNDGASVSGEPIDMSNELRKVALMLRMCGDAWLGVQSNDAGTVNELQDEGGGRIRIR